MRGLLLLLALALTAGCASTGTNTPQTQSEPSPAPAPSGQPCTETPTSYGWGWDCLVKSGITPKMRAATQQPLCKKQIDPERFWVGLARSIAYGESYEWRKGRKYYGKVDPTSTYTESFVDSLTGKLAESVGLFQLSVGDKLRYRGMCTALTSGALRDPMVNVGCAIIIMDTLTGTRSDLQTSLGRYWSTVRPGGRAIARLKIELPECF